MECTQALEQDPAQAGKAEMEFYITELAGFDVRAVPKRADKEIAARPASAQAEALKVKLVRGAWNKAFLDELENFPKAKHDDQVDGFSGAISFLESDNIKPAAGETVPPRPDQFTPESRKQSGRSIMLKRPFISSLFGRRSS